MVRPASDPEISSQANSFEPCASWKSIRFVRATQGNSHYRAPTHKESSMSNRILEVISSFFVFGTSQGFASWGDFAATSVKALAAIALTYPMLMLFFI